MYLPDVDLGVIASVKGDYANTRLIPADYARYAVVLDMVVGDSLLDVGPGAGVFLHAASASGRFDRLGSVDHLPLARFSDGIEAHIADAATLPFDDDSWDTVSAQEILEHLPDGKMEQALAELRRVARRRLIATIPYQQPWPPPKTSGHVQRFDTDRLARLFPRCPVTVLDKGNGRYSWALVVEDVA